MNEWAAKLGYSTGIRQQTDISTIQSLIPGCVSVRKTTKSEDRRGVDYVATLRRGAEVFIDSKTREPGASRYWNHAPELALEIYSVKPDSIHTAKVGWTLNEASPVDLIFYTFDPSDTPECYLLPFQHLRMAFRQNFHAWKSIYRRKDQTSRHGSLSWRSECMFVPAGVVLGAIDLVSRCVVMRDFVDNPL